MSYILFQARQCDARAPRYPCTGLGEVSDFLRWVEFDLADDVLQGAPAGMGGMGNEQRVRDRAAVPPASALASSLATQISNTHLPNCHTSVYLHPCSEGAQIMQEGWGHRGLEQRSQGSRPGAIEMAVHVGQLEEAALRYFLFHLLL